MSVVSVIMKLKLIILVDCIQAEYILSSAIFRELGTTQKHENNF